MAKKRKKLPWEGVRDPATRVVLRNADPAAVRRRLGPEPPKWTIRGVDRETRTVIEKASDRAGKTLGEYFSTEVREFAANQVKRNSLPPMSPTDIRDQLKNDVEAMELRIAASTKEQLSQLRQDLLAARNAPERKGFLARLFG